MFNVHELVVRIICLGHDPSIFHDKDGRIGRGSSRVAAVLIGISGSIHSSCGGIDITGTDEILVRRRDNEVVGPVPYLGAVVDHDDHRVIHREEALECFDSSICSGEKKEDQSLSPAYKNARTYPRSRRAKGRGC